MSTHGYQPTQTIFQNDLHRTTTTQAFARLFQPQQTNFGIAGKGGAQGISDSHQVLDTLQHFWIIR